MEAAWRADSSWPYRVRVHRLNIARCCSAYNLLRRKVLVDTDVEAVSYTPPPPLNTSSPVMAQQWLLGEASGPISAVFLLQPLHATASSQVRHGTWCHEPLACQGSGKSWPICCYSISVPVPFGLKGTLDVPWQRCNQVLKLGTPASLTHCDILWLCFCF